jgi:hypothetical protein
MGEGSSTPRVIDLGDNFGNVAVRVNGVRVNVLSDGSILAYTSSSVKINGVGIDVGSDGTVNVKPGPVHVHPAANDSAVKAIHEIGAIESAGEHKGEIYSGIYPADKKPIWFSTAPKLMDHYKAAAWAEGQGGSLPTRKQGDYLNTLKGKGGAFTEVFNRGNSFPAGYVWLAEPDASSSYYAWCQRLSDGDQNRDSRSFDLPVLCVLR